MSKSISAAVLATLIGVCASPLAAQLSDRPPSLHAAFPDIDGNVFEPGEEIQVQWTLTGKTVREWETHPWGECELMYSTDNGRNWLRITPQLSISRRTATWIVPDTPTENARLALQIGIEGDGEFHLFPSRRFSIRPSGGVPEVRIVRSGPTTVRPGSVVTIGWSSTVRDAVRYEVAVSSDRGAHFFKAGETTATRFSYRIPADYDGSLTFQVTAHRPSGPSVRSAIDGGATFVVKGE